MHYKHYLIQRETRYGFRMKVPLRLRPLLGKIEVRRALGTSDLSIARMHAQRMVWITLRLFESMKNNKTKTNLTSQRINDHLDNWYDQMLEHDLEVAQSIKQGLWGQTKVDYQNSLDHIQLHPSDLLESIVDRGIEPERPDWDQPKVPADAGREEALK